MRLLPDTQNCGLRVHRECRECFPRVRPQMKPPASHPGMHHGTCVTHTCRGAADDTPVVLLILNDVLQKYFHIETTSIPIYVQDLIATVFNWVDFGYNISILLDPILNKIWWLCLVPTSTTRFASVVGYRMAKNLIGLYKEIILMNNNI